MSSVSGHSGHQAPAEEQHLYEMAQPTAAVGEQDDLDSLFGEVAAQSPSVTAAPTTTATEPSPAAAIPTIAIQTVGGLTLPLAPATPAAAPTQTVQTVGRLSFPVATTTATTPASAAVPETTKPAPAPSTSGEELTKPDPLPGYVNLRVSKPDESRSASMNPLPRMPEHTPRYNTLRAKFFMLNSTVTERVNKWAKVYDAWNEAKSNGDDDANLSEKHAAAHFAQNAGQVALKAMEDLRRSIDPQVWEIFMANVRNDAAHAREEKSYRARRQDYLKGLNIEVKKGNMTVNEARQKSKDFEESERLLREARQRKAWRDRAETVSKIESLLAEKERIANEEYLKRQEEENAKRKALAAAETKRQAAEEAALTDPQELARQRSELDDLADSLPPIANLKSNDPASEAIPEDDDQEHWDNFARRLADSVYGDGWRPESSEAQTTNPAEGFVDGAQNLTDQPANVVGQEPSEVAAVNNNPSTSTDNNNPAVTTAPTISDNNHNAVAMSAQNLSPDDIDQAIAPMVSFVEAGQSPSQISGDDNLNPAVHAVQDPSTALNQRVFNEAMQEYQQYLADPNNHNNAGESAVPAEQPAQAFSAEGIDQNQFPMVSYTSGTTTGQPQVATNPTQTQGQLSGTSPNQLPSSTHPTPAAVANPTDSTAGSLPQSNDDGASTMPPNNEDEAQPDNSRGREPAPNNPNPAESPSSTAVVVRAPTPPSADDDDGLVTGNPNRQSDSDDSEDSAMDGIPTQQPPAPAPAPILPSVPNPGPANLWGWPTGSIQATWIMAAQNASFPLHLINPAAQQAIQNAQQLFNAPQFNAQHIQLLNSLYGLNNVPNNHGQIVAPGGNAAPGQPSQATQHAPQQLPGFVQVPPAPSEPSTPSDGNNGGAQTPLGSSGSSGSTIFNSSGSPAPLNNRNTTKRSATDARLPSNKPPRKRRNGSNGRVIQSSPAPDRKRKGSSPNDIVSPAAKRPRTQSRPIGNLFGAPATVGGRSNVMVGQHDDFGAPAGRPTFPAGQQHSSGQSPSGPFGRALAPSNPNGSFNAPARQHRYLNTPAVQHGMNTEGPAMTSIETQVRAGATEAVNRLVTEAIQTTRILGAGLDETVQIEFASDNKKALIEALISNIVREVAHGANPLNTARQGYIYGFRRAIRLVFEEGMQSGTMLSHPLLPMTEKVQEDVKQALADMVNQMLREVLNTRTHTPMPGPRTPAPIHQTNVGDLRNGNQGGTFGNGLVPENRLHTAHPNAAQHTMGFGASRFRGEHRGPQNFAGSDDLFVSNSYQTQHLQPHLMGTTSATQIPSSMYPNMTNTMGAFVNVGPRPTALEIAAG
ncbi:hypothetical protein VTJ04DRAFT_8802 [Mycothermus thermophilus]|uniref:uncharacterized protein n=1 Tax=Humicola insolens TaxID=85995 RepID=UPI003742F3FC